MDEQLESCIRWLTGGRDAKGTSRSWPRPDVTSLAHMHGPVRATWSNHETRARLLKSRDQSEVDRLRPGLSATVVLE